MQGPLCLHFPNQDRAVSVQPSHRAVSGALEGYQLYHRRSRRGRRHRGDVHELRPADAPAWRRRGCIDPYTRCDRFSRLGCERGKAVGRPAGRRRDRGSISRPRRDGCKPVVRLACEFHVWGRDWCQRRDIDGNCRAGLAPMEPGRQEGEMQLDPHHRRRPDACKRLLLLFMGLGSRHTAPYLKTLPHAGIIDANRDKSI